MTIRIPADSRRNYLEQILYFGVGGGLVDFIRQVEARGGESEDVKSWPKGVGRKVVRLSWPEAT